MPMTSSIICFLSVCFCPSFFTVRCDWGVVTWMSPGGLKAGYQHSIRAKHGKAVFIVINGSTDPWFIPAFCQRDSLVISSDPTSKLWVVPGPIQCFLCGKQRPQFQELESHQHTFMTAGQFSQVQERPFWCPESRIDRWNRGMFCWARI